MDNYHILNNGVIKQIKVNKIKYDFDYSNKYNDYGEKANYLAFLRLGVLLGHVMPSSVLDVGYGNGAFLKACSTIIKDCNGYDVSDYPLPLNVNRAEELFDRHYDVITFFDSLEHFDDINIIKNLNCDYIFISVPWCHNFSEEWFLKWYHLRPNEHLWHFNEKSLIQFFKENGYQHIYTSNFEDAIRVNHTLNGNANILSCIFKKTN